MFKYKLVLNSRGERCRDNELVEVANPLGGAGSAALLGRLQLQLLIATLYVPLQWQYIVALQVRSVLYHLLVFIPFLLLLQLLLIIDVWYSLY
jgi:hypothetical protein